MKLSLSKIVLLLLLVAAAAAGGVAYLILTADVDSYRRQIVEQASRALNRSVSYGSGSFSFRPAPSFTFTDVVIKEREGNGNLLKASRLTVKLALLPLLKKQLVLRQVSLDSPRVALQRNADGTLSIADLVQPGRPGTLQVRGIRLHHAAVVFDDRAAGMVTTVSDADLFIDRMVRGRKCSVTFRGKVGQGKGDAGAKVSADLKLHLAEEREPLAASSVQGKVQLHDVPVGSAWGYWARYVPFEKPAGSLDMDTALDGTLERFSCRGTARISGLIFRYPAVFHAVLQPKQVRLSFSLSKTPDEVSVRDLSLQVDRLQVNGSCRVAEMRSGDPRITAYATTSRFRLEEFGAYVPYGIIADDASQYIEEHIKGGTYQLLDGRLDGKASQIAHMEVGDNNKVLYIRGTVEEGIVSYGPSIPRFHKIQGELQLAGKDFTLRGMSGSFGGSPFHLEGQIRDYCLTVPSSYPFTMSITPRQEELHWLTSQIAPFSYSGTSLLRLSGDGTTSSYRLGGEWDLALAAYGFGKNFHKSEGKQSSLTFRSTLEPEKVTVHEAHYRSGALAATASASLLQGKKPHLAFSLDTGRFPAAELAELLPRLAAYQPKGNLQLHLKGKGPPQLEGLDLEGKVQFAGLAVKPGAPVADITDITGSAVFHGQSAETSLLSARIGTSAVYARIIASDFDSPTLTVAFSSPSIDLRDLGGDRKKALRVTAVQGNISRRSGGEIQIRSLSGQLGSSVLTVKGTLAAGSGPVDLSVSSPKLEANDLFLLAGVETGDKSKAPRSVRVSLRADELNWKDFRFEKMSCTAAYESYVLRLEEIQSAAFGGKLFGKAKIGLPPGGAPMYEVDGSLENASADRFLQAMGVRKRELRGTMTLQASLSSRGNDAAEIKKTLNGTVKMRCVNGSMHRFSVLSKIFSILNVSQLLKFQLPDMVSGGMPYDSIKGTLTFRDGVVSTSDLFVKSDAMNMSAVGTVNLPREQVHLTVGVQPLQTVDKIVNRIPVVGWILTGKDRALISSYFEVKGPLSDPDVSAVPVKAMAKGVFDIFKRVFQLPAKLFTDTGEVITGR